ncbi:hypothetical protein ACN6LC_004645 [Streptomyces violaceoruber]|uniref:hypothetical protein n=1 Tax=Streptomyces violaceoruber TaxID=1935 RepID=UPI00403CB77D
MTKPEKKRGVRIPYVRDARGDRYDRSAIDVQPHPPYAKPLTCWECGIDVHVRHGNADDPDSTSSHYVKNPGKQHGPRCAYDLERRGKELVESSASTVVRKAGQWRLLCPPIERPGTRGAGKNVPGPRSGQSPSGGGQAKTSKEAGQAIASARRIVRLLEAFGQDPDAVAEFAATAPGGRRNIAWPEFCRGRADAHQLAQDLIDGTTAPIPHAVWGPVSTAAAVDGKAGRSYVVKYVARHPVLVGGRRLPLQVTLRSPNADWIGATTRSGQFLGYGYWTLFPRPEEVEGRIELQLWIKEPWQVARWDTDGTTQSFPAPPARHVPARSPADTQEEPATPQAGPGAGVADAPPAGPALPPRPVQPEPPTPPVPQSALEATAAPSAQPGPAASCEKYPSKPHTHRDGPGTPTERAAQDATATEATEPPTVPPMPVVPPKPAQPPQPSSPPPPVRRRPRWPGWLGRRTGRR